jgi:integrase
MKTADHSSEFASSGSSPGSVFNEDNPGRMCMYHSEGTCHFQPAHAILPQAIPEKRKRGKSMSRRSQVGSIEKSGKWYVVRFWKDIPGEERRIHASERICPISGEGSLTKAQRQTKALEIVRSSGVNSEEKFAETTIGITFREQAKLFIKQKTTSKRKPVKPATLSTWENCLAKWLNPNIGDLPLANVNNGVLKRLVAQMSAANLSAKTIINYTGLVKLVVASAKNEEGEPLFPRKWDSEFIDLPIVGNQRQPKFSAETMSSIVENTTGQYRVLYALLAGSGLRIGEALGLEIENISADRRTLHIRQSVWEGTTQKPKTASAIRDVDLFPALATMLDNFIGDRKKGFVFRNEVGRPFAQSNVLRRSLHPVLKSLQVPKAGFHAFRRFRATHLSKSRVPESLVKFWMGHSEANQTEEYVKLFDEVVYRREVADSIGIGFELRPEKPIVRNVRRKSVKVEVGVAA